MHRTPLTALVLLAVVVGSVVVGCASAADASVGAPGNRGWETGLNRGWSTDYDPAAAPIAN